MYKVLIRFKDKNHQVVYEKGDTYPKDGIVVSEERLIYLESGDNVLARPLIEKIEVETEEKTEQEEKTKTEKKQTKKGK